MGFIGKFAKGAVATKLISEARKPHNQEKMKRAASSLKSKFGSNKKSGPPTQPRPPH